MCAMTQDVSEGIPAGVETTVRGITQFAQDLYRTQQAAPGNLLISPYSISIALAMTYAGARGETAAQMARALHFDPDQKLLHLAFAALEGRLADIGQRGAVQLHVANRLWPQEGYEFREAFLALVRQCYRAPVTPVDYRNTEGRGRRSTSGWRRRPNARFKSSSRRACWTP